ncbi:unnamed protein product [Rotaria sp. Silwood2]|nr:unnamed protein product [Rotaria sp. Silwood2]
MKNNQSIASSDRIVLSIKGNKVHSLTIKQVVPSDAGYYTVKVILDNGTSVSNAQAIVEIVSTFVKLLQIITIVDGQDYEIDIEVYGLPPPNIKWLYLIISNGNHHQLHIYHVTAQDADEYQVVCLNNLGHLLVSIKRTARLDTQIHAFSKPKIIWSKDAIPIDFSLYSRRINAEQRQGTYALTIKNLQLDDKGFYVYAETYQKFHDKLLKESDICIESSNQIEQQQQE